MVKDSREVISEKESLLKASAVFSLPVSRLLFASVFKGHYLNVTSKGVEKNSRFRFFESKEQM
jgi:hypothetical protein